MRSGTQTKANKSVIGLGETPTLTGSPPVFGVIPTPSPLSLGVSFRLLGNPQIRWIL